MPMLMQVKKNVVQNRVALDAKPLTLGRAPDNDIQLEDRAVSSHHARIEWVPPAGEDAKGHHRLVDLDSTNGSFINEEKCQARPLAHNDTLRLGFVTFRYIDEQHQSFDQTAKVHKSWIPGVYVTKD